MALWLQPAEFLLNQALEADQESRQQLHDFDNQVLALEVTDLALHITVHITDARLKLDNKAAVDAELTLSGDSAALINLARDPDSLFSSAITLHGNVRLAKQLQDWLQQFDFDWEALLARVTGQTLAYPLAQLFRAGFSTLRDNQQALMQTTAEYLREESRLLPDKSEVRLHLEAVDTLQADVERLGARIKRLQSAMPDKTKEGNDT